MTCYPSLIAEKIKSYNATVIGIHAVQAPITNEKFIIWGKEVADFARALRVKTITLHPNNVNKGEGVQKKALDNLEYFAKQYNGESARDRVRQHLPIDSFCKEVAVHYLIADR